MEEQMIVSPAPPAAEKPEVVAAYRQSGLSLRAFARQQGVSLSTLHRWVSAGRVVRRTEPKPVQLVEVPNLLGQCPSPYRLHFPTGLMLEVASGFQAQELQVLVQMLQSL